MKHQPRCLTVCLFALIPAFAACSGTELDPNPTDAGETAGETSVTFPREDAGTSASENVSSSDESSASPGSTEGMSNGSQPSGQSADTQPGTTENGSTGTSGASGGSHTSSGSTDSFASGHSGGSSVASGSDASSDSSPTPTSSASSDHGSSAGSSESSSSGETYSGSTDGTTSSTGTTPTLPPCVPPRDDDSADNDSADNEDADAGLGWGVDAGTGPDGSPRDIRSDLVLLLEMDEPSFSENDRVLDSSGLDNHGSPRGSVINTTEGRFGGGAAFDGNGWISIPDSTSFDATTGLTLSAWVKFDQLVPGEAPGLIAKRWGFAMESAFALFVWDQNRVWLDVDSENDRFCSRQTLEADTWYHVAVVFDGTLPESRRVKVYLNGELDSVARETSTSVPSNDAPIEVGRLVNGGQNLYGTLDEVAVWTRALSPSEAQSLPHLDL